MNEKTKPLPKLLPPAEIRALFKRALALAEAVHEREDAEDDDDDDDDDDRFHALSGQFGCALEAIRFCCVAAGQSGDVSLVPLIAEALRFQEGYDEYAYPHPHLMGEALGELLRAGAPVDDDVQALARHRDPQIRQAVAEGLRPRGERALKLLEALAADPVADVRNAAKATLAAVREVPWWQGKLRSDPTAKLSPEQALALKPVFEGLSALLDLPRYQLWKHEDRLVELCAALPDAPAVELLELLYTGSERHELRHIAPLTALLARPGGVEAFIRLCGVWNAEGGFIDGDRVAAAITALPAPRRVEVCRELAAWAAARPARSRRKQTGDAARLVAEAAGAAWPPGEDLTPLLDLLLGIEALSDRGELDWVLHGLAKAFDAPGADHGTILDRLVEARVGGCPGPWAKIRWVVDKALERASGPALRLGAEKAVLSPDEGLRAWGMARLLGAAHDPARDGALLTVVERFLGDPATRRVMLRNDQLARRAVAPLRAALRAGGLDFEAAVVAMRAIGALWGGVAFHAYPLLPSKNREEEQAKAREALADFLGPPELHGPPTPAEWAALRAARARHLSSPELVADAPKHIQEALRCGLTVLPLGPWDPEDRAVLEAALARLRAGDAGVAVAIGAALSDKARPEDLPLFDELIKLGPEHARPLLKLTRKGLREALGVPPPARAAGGEEAGGAGGEGDGDREWMDEEDD